MFLQKQSSSTADQGRCHGGAAHPDIMSGDDVFPAATLQCEIIIGGEDRNDIVTRRPQVWKRHFFSGEKRKGWGQEIVSVFPCAYGDDTAADGGGRTMSVSSIRIAGGSNNDDAHLPEPFCGFFQREIDFPVVGADGKIHYSDIIFAKIVHYPSKCFYSLGGITLPVAVQDFEDDDVRLRRDPLPDTVRKISISTGDARDMGHGSETMFLLLFVYFCGTINR